MTAQAHNAAPHNSNTPGANPVLSAAEALLEAPEAPEPYQTLADAIFAAPERLTSWTGPERDAALRQLLRQAPCPAAPPIFALAATRHLTSGNQGAVRRVTQTLAPLLQEALTHPTAFDEGQKNTLIFALVTRAVAGDWLDQVALTKRHLAQFTQFKMTDIALLYSVMFNPDLFGQNRDEILAHLWPGGAAPLGLSPDQLLFLSWLSGKEAFSARDLGKFRAYTNKKWPIDQQPACRALALRYGDAGTLGQLMPGGKLSAFQKQTPPVKLPPHEMGGRPYQAVQVARQTLSVHAPFLSRSDRKRRVAICVSGQLRGYTHALESWRHVLLGQVEATFFVQSWQKIGRADAQPFRQVLPFAGSHFPKAYREIAVSAGIDKMRADYPKIFAALEHGSIATEDQIRAAYDTPHVVLDDETQAPFNNYTNQQKMHSKIFAANQMAEEAGDFDLHIRIRPDLAITHRGFNWQDMHEACSAAPRLMAEKPYGVHYSGLMIGDQFAMGAPETMAAYAATWERHPAISAAKVAGCPKDLKGHVSLAICSWLAGLSVEKAPIRFGKLQDATPLSSAEIKKALEADSRANPQDQTLIRAVLADLKN